MLFERPGGGEDALHVVVGLIPRLPARTSRAADLG